MSPNGVLGFSIAALTLLPACKAADAGAPAGGAAAPAPASSPAARVDPGWPREVSAPVGRLVMYQPQIDGWDDDDIRARMAVAVTLPGEKEPHYGAVRLKADTYADPVGRVVTISDIEIEKVDFPAKSVDAKSVRRTLEALLPDKPVTLSLDRVLAALAANAQRPRPVAVRNDPPDILIGRAPAALVPVDGEPYLQAIPGTDLMSVVNTASDVVLSKSDGRYYLLAGDRWMTAPDLLRGPWTPAKAVPASVDKIPADHPRGNMAGVSPADSKDPPVNVYVSTRSAELVVFAGEPEYVAIPGTKLLYARNTAADLFQHLGDGHQYLLLAGRWFRTKDLAKGPWAYVPGEELPGDFAAIPDGHPKEDVLTFVPGTEEADEALIAATIPQKAVINRAEAKLTVVYAGEPKFAPVEGTALLYATNSNFDVVRVGNEYYCCYQAVWFAAPSPTGPWVAATTVPAAVYTIPPSSPIYHVTYVRVYESTPTTIVVGYAPGYYGCYVGGTTVVYGTGYRYPGAVVAGVWIGAAITWGICASYDHYHGGFVCGGWYHCGRHYDGCRAGYHATVGWATGPNGGAAWVGGGVRRPGYGNSAWVAGGVHNGNAWAAAGYRSNNAYASWGERVVASNGEWIHGKHYTDSRGTVRGVKTSGGGVGGSVRTDDVALRGFKTGEGNSAVRLKTDDNRTTVVRGDDNVYVGRNGNIYRNSGDGWEKNDGDSWSQVEKPNRDPGGDAGSRGGRPPRPKPEPRPEINPGGRPGTLPSDRPDVNPGGRPGTLPADRPDVNPGGKPSTQPVRQVPSDVQRDRYSRERGAQRQQTYQQQRPSRPQPSGPPPRNTSRPRGR